MTNKYSNIVINAFNNTDAQKPNNQLTDSLRMLRLATAIIDYCPTNFDKNEIQATLELNGICREEAALIIKSLPAFA